MESFLFISTFKKNEKCVDITQLNQSAVLTVIIVSSCSQLLIIAVEKINWHNLRVDRKYIRPSQKKKLLCYYTI